MYGDRWVRIETDWPIVILYIRESGFNYNNQKFIDIQNKGVIIVDSLEKLIEVMN